MSRAGETNIDGKAHKEGDEVRRIILLSNPRYAFAKLLSAGKLNSRRRLKEASGSNTKKVRQM